MWGDYGLVDSCVCTSVLSICVRGDGGELVDEGKIKHSSGDKWCLSGFCFIAESIILSNQLVVEQASN